MTIEDDIAAIAERHRAATIAVECGGTLATVASQIHEDRGTLLAYATTLKRERDAIAHAARMLDEPDSDLLRGTLRKIGPDVLRAFLTARGWVKACDDSSTRNEVWYADTSMRGEYVYVRTATTMWEYPTRMLANISALASTSVPRRSKAEVLAYLMVLCDARG